MSLAIDLNADLGEGYDNDAALLGIVSSCNIACGGHAGDRDSMRQTIAVALQHGVNVGAHPGYPDKAGFGRVSEFLDGNALYESLSEQVDALAGHAAAMGARLTHIKPHGALYNDAVRRDDLAAIIARVVAEAPGSPALLAMANSAMASAAADHRIGFLGEAFVDRAYMDNGTLVPRSEPHAVHHDSARVASQAVQLVTEQQVTSQSGKLIAVHADSLCIHGDTPGAVESARALRDVLETHDVKIRAPA